MKKAVIGAFLLLGLATVDLHAQQASSGDSQTARRGRFQDMTQVEESALPSTVMPYVKEHYPNATVRRIVKDKESNYHVVVAADTTRKRLIFDAKGAFKEETVMQGRRGGRPGGGNPTN